QWHFINYPIGAHGGGAEPADSVPKRGWWLRLPRDMNAVQAMQAHKAIVQDPTQAAADRALSLTWLCHIVGDLHEPLHTTSLFTEKRFRDGDRGGNEIPIEEQGSSRNLHALWDSLAGHSASDQNQKRRAEQLAERFPASAQVASDGTDVKVWVQESVFLSRNLAYDPAILTHVNTYDRTRGKLAPLRVSEDYIDMAREVAEQRITLAGYRLAALLADVLASDSENE
ncbi:MAG: S1/P1 nuclease, partial [Pseudomonadales bacterium]